METYKSLGAKFVGTTEFNGRQVEEYESVVPSQSRHLNGDGIQLPYIEDLGIVSLRVNVLIDPSLNMLLQSSRWAIDENGHETLIESMQVLKSKVDKN